MPKGPTAQEVLAYFNWRQGLEKLSDDELAMELLRHVEPFGKAGNIAEIVAERLSPGVIERMAGEEAL